jgi:Polyketide cyclase / dehydrase and lipid transport
MLEINRGAPLVIREGVSVEAPPSVVFATLADFAAWPTWQSNVSRVTAESSAAPGLRFSWRAGGVNITSTVELFEPPLAVGWTGRSIGTRAVHIWRVAEERGGTRVATEESMEGWFPSLPLFGSLARKSVRRAVSTTVAELKQEAEAATEFGGDGDAG